MGRHGGRVTVVKYIGSKRALLPWIVSAVALIGEHEPVRVVADLFAGTGRVSHALKAAGYRVIANDLMSYSYVLCRALIEADACVYLRERVQPLLDDLMTLPPLDGWFARLYSEEARFFHPRNARRIQAVREAIEAGGGSDPILRSVLLTSLLLAADRVDSTTGVQMAYLKQWAPRAFHDLRLTYPPLLAGVGVTMQGDAVEVAGGIDADVVYLDPPYNQHSYLGNYHVWETLVLWDRPQTYGVARKRIDCRTRKSAFNLRTEAHGALRRLLGALRCRHVVMSFSNEGYFQAAEVERYLGEYWYVTRLDRDYKRYVGALIGIYNPNGLKVGTVSHTQNREHLFIGTKSQAVHDALGARAGAQEASAVRSVFPTA